ncbi:MAG: dehypoxanthine futalosine cyclase, partial [Chloroflexi bacterium]|nr:dehypoxanthine futalosine cyclase [Chloroflexota bacterium]
MMRTIEATVREGRRLSTADAAYLLGDAPLMDLGALANEVRFQRHPESVVTYVVDTNLNYTNLCDAYCSFCAFYRPHTSTAPDAYTHTVDEMLERMAAAGEMGCTTVRMQG